MSATAETIITERMRSYIGTTMPAVPLPEAIYPSDVRRFLDATEDRNPLWLDDDFARSVGYRGRVVPPMLVIQLYRRTNPEGSDSVNMWPGLVLPEGYADSRNAGAEIEWLAPVYVGDHLTFQNRLVDIYAREGRRALVIYLVRDTEIRNQHGELVVRVHSTTAKLPATTVDAVEERKHG
jgi:acyl dehydratase